MYRLIAILGILVATVTVAEANVIFPAFSAPYVSQILFPIALVSVLVIETSIYKLRSPALGLMAAVLLVPAVNAVSWFAGVLITGSLFPSGLVKSSQGFITTGPQFMLYAMWGFLVAYALSVLIEGVCLKLAARKWPIPSPFTLSLFANTASYITLAALVWWLR